MVNTRKLEQLMKRSGPARTTGKGRPDTMPARRGLALSGGPAQRNEIASAPAEAPAAPWNRAAWDHLDPVNSDTRVDKNVRIFNQYARTPAVTEMFDVLRTQLVQTFRKRGHRCLGIASPYADAGASFVTAGLLASFARRSDLHVVGLDLNFADPALHHYFEAVPNGPILPALAGKIPIESHLQRANSALALGFNQPTPQPEQGNAAFPAEDFADFVQDILGFIAPDFIICDLPPLLQGDTAMNLLTGIDAVLVVSDSRTTSAEDIAACERVLDDQVAFLGVVMNRAAAIPKGR